MEIGELEFRRAKFRNQNFEKLFECGILSKGMSEWNNNYEIIMIG